jgi:Tol biopolymer transport system component
MAGFAAMIATAARQVPGDTPAMGTRRLVDVLLVTRRRLVPILGDEGRWQRHATDHPRRDDTQSSIPSPDGRWVAGTNTNSGEQLIFDGRDLSKAPERLPQPPGRSTTYLWDWSPDGTKIATRDTVGQLRVFTIASKTWESVGTGVFPRWLPDGRRLVAQDRGRMTLVDTITKTARQIYAEPDRGRSVFSIALSPDARRLYYTSAVNEADIWLMRFDQGAGR